MSDTLNENIAFALALIIQCDDKIVGLQAADKNAATSFELQSETNDTFNVRITNVEKRCSSIESRIASLETRCTNLEK